ncbi:MAG: hypothetical protein ACKO5F_11470 [Synechococcus sp.]
MTLSPLCEGSTEHYRGRCLELRQVPQGWTAVLRSKAGPVADVVLHTQLGHTPWPSPEEALAAARHCVDELAEEENSY